MGLFLVVFTCRFCRGWWNATALPVLCDVGKADHILHPGADMSMHLLTDVYHICRRLLLRNTTSSELCHLSLQRTLYLERSLIKICNHLITIIWQPESTRGILVNSGTLPPRGFRQLVGRLPENKTSGIHKGDPHGFRHPTPLWIPSVGGGGRVPESKWLCGSRRVP